MSSPQDGESKKPTSFPSVLDKPLPKGNVTVPLSTFSFVFLEMVQYYQNQVDSASDLEAGLHKAGYGIGLRVLELYTQREKGGRREKTVVDILQFIYSNVWKTLFGKQADGLEKSNEKNDEFYLFEKEPITNKFASVPKTYGQFNCAAFIAGIINGILDAADFPAIVTANWNSTQTQTVYVIKIITPQQP